MNLTITRKYTPEWLDVSAKLLFENFGACNEWETIASAYDCIDKYLKRSWLQHAFALDENRLIGILFTSNLETMLPRNAQYAFGRIPQSQSISLNMLAIDQEYRRRHIGTELVKHEIAHAKSQGMKEAYAQCLNGRNGMSYALMQKLGFIESCTKPYHYRDGSAMTVVWRSLEGAE